MLLRAQAGALGQPDLPRLHASVARTLGIRIVSGAIRPGEMLEGEIEAAARFDVARTVYREAIRVLAAKGLVHARPKIGTQVRPRTDWHLLDPDVLSWTFATDPDPGLIAKLFELRRIVEPDAARLAALRRTDVQLARMHAGLRAMARWGLEAEAGRRGDQDFHAALLEATHNAFVISLTSGVGAAVVLTTSFKLRRLGTAGDPEPGHARILDAIAARDGEGAHDAMAELIDLALVEAIAAAAAHEG